MVKKVSIGVIGIQGAVTEHIQSMKELFKKTGTSGEVFPIKNIEEIKKIDGLIIPGGESTTISRILFEKGFNKEIKKRVETDNLPIMGTCAGCVILAKKLNENNHDVKLLKLIAVSYTHLRAHET